MSLIEGATDFTALTVVIPVYNEEAGVVPTLRDLRKAFADIRIIAVNDGSTDKSREALLSVQKELRIEILEHEFNRGMGAALKTGMRAAVTNCVAWYDSDGQHRPEDLRRVALPVLSGEREVVIGVRDRDSSQQPERVPGKMLLKFFIELAAGQKVPDFNSGLRCFRRDVISRYYHLLPDGFSASTTSMLLMISRGYRIGYVSVTAQKRTGKSSVKMIRDGLLTIHMILRTVILFKAFKFFMIFSLLQLIPGAIYGFYLAFSTGRGFPTFALLLVFSGLLTFFMGIIADQLVELRKERFEH